MAFQSAIVNSAADMRSAIETFAQANGWTLSSGVLSKNGCHTLLSNPSASELRIQNAKNGIFSGNEISVRYSRIFLTSWPSAATLNMVAFSNPDTIWVTMNFDVVRFMHIGFGNIAKYGTWTGGQWFHAQHTSRTKDSNVTSSVDGQSSPNSQNGSSECALFWSPTNYDSWYGGYAENTASSIECDLRGRIWEPPQVSDPSNLHNIQVPTVTAVTHKKNPNVFNGQTILTPFQLWLKASDGFMQCLGHVGHLRFVKLKNYNPGDLITLGSEKWKLYPWHIHDIGNPDGIRNASENLGSTGILGVAVKYDGV